MRICILPTALVAALALATPARSQTTYTLLIDGFAATQHIDTGSENPATSPPLYVPSLFDDTGASRTLYLETDSGHSSQSLDVNLPLFPEFLTLQTAVASTSRVQYDNIGAGTGFNLTTKGATEFLFDLEIHDQPGNWLIDVTDADGDSAQYTFVQPSISSLVTVHAPFAAFTESGPGVTNFNRVTTIRFEIQGVAMDYKLGQFGVGAVPEPSSALLALLGIAILFRRRR